MKELTVFDFIKYDESSPTCLTYTRWIGGKTRVGQKAGAIKKIEAVLFYKKKRYKIADLVWEIHNGAIPEGLVTGYKDGDFTNVKISNLFLQTKRHRALTANHKLGESGAKGVTRLANGTFRARVRHQDAILYAGVHKTIEEAIAARKTAILLTKGHK